MNIVFVLIAFLFAFSQTAHATTGAGVGPSINVPDGWQGNVYKDQATGKFTHCSASAPYVNGTSIIVSIDYSYRWKLAFLNDAWRLTPNSQTTIFVRIDTSPWRSYVGSAYQTDFLVIDMPGSDQEIINLFRFGSVMEIRFDTWQYEFALKGTSRLLRQLAQCVQDQLSPPKISEKTNPKPKPAKETKSPEPNKEAAKKPEEPTSSTGTGIIATSTGLILTNNHVVDGCTSIKFSKEGELTRSASLLRTDRTNDLALLKSDQSFRVSDVATFRITPSLKAGEQIAVYGFPLTGLLSLSGNVVSGNVSSLAGIGDDVRFYQVSAPVQPGNSGGPLLDYSGNVVGIVTARIDDFIVAGATGALPQNVNFAIKSPIATSFMDTHGVEYKYSTGQPEGSLASVVDAAKKFTVLIECKRE